MIQIERLFKDKRICGLAGGKSSGKSNNLVALIKNFREHNKTTPIYTYGLNHTTLKYLQKFGKVFEISQIDQLSNKTNCLIILEEFQRLNLNDRRYKERLDGLIDFIYHNNNWLIFSSPNLREYNSIIGSKIEVWALKSLKYKDLVNGSQLKGVVTSYKGRFKVLNDIVVGKDTIIVINEDYEQLLVLPYIEEVDEKKNLQSIFVMKNPKELSEKKSEVK